MADSSFPEVVTGVTVETATDGALSGDGSALNKLAVGVDGVTVTVNGDNQLVASGGGGTPGGSDTQIQFNDAGSFGGSADLTFDGSVLTSAKPVNVGDPASVNGLQLQNDDGALVAIGPGSDAPVNIAAKGAGTINLNSPVAGSGGNALTTHTGLIVGDGSTGNVDTITLVPGGTGDNAVSISAQGTDTDVSLQVSAQGAGVISFQSPVVAGALPTSDPAVAGALWVDPTGGLYIVKVSQG